MEFDLMKRMQTINSVKYTAKLLKLAARLQKVSQDGRLGNDDAEAWMQDAHTNVPLTNELFAAFVGLRRRGDWSE